MPLPMVHFCTARECVHDISTLIDCPEFYLGSISPDAIHMRPGADKFSKRITHFHADSGQWINNVLKFLKQNKDKFNYSFIVSNNSFDIEIHMDSPVSFCGIDAEKAIKETTRVAKKKVIMTVSR